MGVITWLEGFLVVYAVGHADYEAQIHRIFLGPGAAQGKASGGAISACRPAYVRPVVKAATLNT